MSSVLVPLVICSYGIMTKNWTQTTFQTVLLLTLSIHVLSQLHHLIWCASVSSPLSYINYIKMYYCNIVMGHVKKLGVVFYWTIPVLAKICVVNFIQHMILLRNMLFLCHHQRVIKLVFSIFPRISLLYRLKLVEVIQWAGLCKKGALHHVWCSLCQTALKVVSPS